ncbi:MAG: PAS domain S-box protein [Actinobacteria bacterium]|nr:PAS domain S-box protein [Actinomycetota bacterium]
MIEGRQQAQKEAEAVFSEVLLEALPDGVITYRQDGQCRSANRTASDLLGVSLQCLLSQNFRTISSWKEWGLLARAEETMKTGSSQEWETPFVSTAGRSLWLRFRLERIELEREPTLLLIFTDISGRKAIEGSLELTQISVDLAPDFIHWIGPEGQILGVSESGCTRYGYSREEMLHLTVFDLDPELRPETWAERWGVNRRGIPLIIESVHRTKAGELFPVEVTRTYVQHGEREYVVAFARDISERKRAEEAVRRASQYNRSLIEAALDPLVTIGPDGTITDVNEATVKVTGRTREELLGTDFSTYFTDPESARRGYMEVFTTGSVTDYPLTIRSAGGMPTDVLYNASLYRDQQGRVLGVFAAARDITEHKRAKEVLSESEERFRGVFEQNSVGIALLGTDLRITKANCALCQMLGYGESELVGKTISDITAEEDVKRSLESVHSLYESGQPVLNMEKRYLRKDGEVIWGHVSASVLRGKDGKPVGTVAVISDVSARKKTEEALRLTQLSVDQAADLIHWIDPDGRILYVSDSMCERGGYSRDELLGMSILDLDPSQTPDSWDRHWRELKEKGSIVFESVHRTKQGEVFPVELTVNYVESEGKEYNFAFGRDISERKRAEEALKTSQAQLEAAMDLADMVNWELDVERRVFTFNDRFYSLYGTTAAREGGYEMPADVYAQTFLHPDERNMLAEEVQKAVQSNDPNFRGYLEHRIVRRDGEIRHINVRYGITKDEHGRTIKTHGANQDITERKRTEEALALAEEQLRQAQKMEAVGQLAGGIAHDFNNLLTAIMGYADLLLAPDHVIDGSCRPDLEEIRNAAERASTLTRQILAFSRRQALRPSVVSLNEVIGGTDRLLRRTLGEDIDLVTLLCADLGRVELDISQFEQVLINLVLNARDAMSQGGKLTIETANVELGEDYARSHPGVKPGLHVMLAVSDTGTGMSTETAERAFEPFFTTKEPGKGTGLGLSTVYGIVKQSGGNIYLYSELGRGTTVKIYLPRVEKPTRETPAEEAERTDSIGGSETILVVEDEEAVRTLVGRVLCSLGYKVITACRGAEALSILASSNGFIDLLLTDVILPGELQGNHVAQEAKVTHPDLPVLYMSGYTRDAIVHAGRLQAGVDYLEKPFTPDRLGHYVREILDRQKAELKLGRAC